MICLGKYEEVIDQIDNSPIKTVELNAIRILASYFAFPAKKEESVKAISLLLNEELGNTSLVRIIACTIFNNENDFEHAYLTVQNAESIEELSVLVYTLVRMNRFDLASDIYKKMQRIDDDHVLSQLASTWIESNGVCVFLSLFFIYRIKMQWRIQLLHMMIYFVIIIVQCLLIIILLQNFVYVLVRIKWMILKYIILL